MKTKLFVFIFVLGLTSLISGCAGMTASKYLDSTRTRLIEEGKPDSYIDGYLDGCSSGMRLASDKNFEYRKDNIRYDRDALYAKGWQDGQICCRNEALIQRQNEANAAAYECADEAESQRRQATKRAHEEEMRMMWEEMKK